ncbi:MAG: methionine--tRNA ligase [Candidatus Woesearchaeota archaeon]
MAKKVLITSALPYANNIPHLGNIIGAVLSADVYARFCRSRGYETLYICGTDEHGTATETKALEEGVTPQEICDKYYKIHRDIYRWFNISFDSFGRTATNTQVEITQEIFLKLHENGYIEEKQVEQLFCRTCDKFLADRFVEGTCPYCGFEDARGDQCDGCGKLLNAPELQDPRCKVCGSAPELKESEHLFLNLPELEGKLREWIEECSPNWSQNARTITQGWLNEGLKSRAISRDLKWGVPIPLEKYKDKVFYVWFDAPIGYISITKDHLGDAWKDWWFGDASLVQFMGKDNVPFHTIIFPATLLGTGDKYTMLDSLSATEYLNYEHSKFSKSRGIGVFGTDLFELDIPSDVFRYYLLRVRPERADTQFSWSDFQEKVNNELVANLGNLVNRTATFISRQFGFVPDAPVDTDLMKILSEETRKATELLENRELKEGLKQIMHISRIGNQYFQEQEPWKAIKENPEKARTALHSLACLCRDLAILIEPYMPKTAEEIEGIFGLEKGGWDKLGSDISETQVKQKLLFARVEDDFVSVMHKRFSGKRSFPLKLKAGKILGVRNHPTADKLYLIDVDLGDEKRQVVAGLRSYYTVDELEGKSVVLVANLKPAKLRGEKSEGMLLAAESEGVVRLVGHSSEKGKLFVPVDYEPQEELIDIKDFSSMDLRIKSGKLQCNGIDLLDDNKQSPRVDMPDGSQAR